MLGPPSFTNPGTLQQPGLPVSGYISNGGLAGDLHFGTSKQNMAPPPAPPPAASVGSIASSFNNMSLASPHKVVSSPLLSSSSASGHVAMTMARATPCSNGSPGLPRPPPTHSGGTAPPSGLPVSSSSMQPPRPPFQMNTNVGDVGSDVCTTYNGTELVMLYDYKVRT